MTRVPAWARTPSEMHDDMRFVDMVPPVLAIALIAALDLWVHRSGWYLLLLIPGFWGMYLTRRYIPSVPTKRALFMELPKVLWTHADYDHQRDEYNLMGEQWSLPRSLRKDPPLAGLVHTKVRSFTPHGWREFIIVSVNWDPGGLQYWIAHEYEPYIARHKVMPT